MKNLNLTGLYLTLIAYCDVSGFDLSSIRKESSLEPSDALITFKFDGVINLNEVINLVKQNITGDVKQLTVDVKNDNNLVIYIEFIGPDLDDNYAYKN